MSSVCTGVSRYLSGVDGQPTTRSRTSIKKNLFNMVRIIINADDLGLSHEVNSAISAALSQKCITSSTILANTDLWNEVHQIVDNNPQASFGVHLNLTQGKALTDSKVLKQYGIVDEKNIFTKTIRNHKNFTQVLQNAIFEEWDAQVNLVKNVENIPVSHLDGHHHCHTYIGLETVLAQVLQKHDIKKVRNCYHTPHVKYVECIKYYIAGALNCFGVHKFPGVTNVLQIMQHYDTYNKVIGKTGTMTTGFFGQYEIVLNLLKNRQISLPSELTIELMCHPGHERYAREYELIKNNSLDNVIDNCSYISFKEL